MVAVTVFKLLLTLSVGYYLYKKNILTEKVNKSLSYFIVNICSPLMILSSMNFAAGHDKKEMLSFILTGTAIYLVMPFVGKLFNRVMRVPKDERDIYECLLTFNNYTFIGYPVAAVLYGEGCIFEISTFHIISHLMLYTYGMRKISGKPSEGSLVNRLKANLNNGIIAALIALTFFFLDMEMPGFIAEPSRFIGSLAPALSLIVTGATLGTYPIKEMLGSNKKIYAVTFMKMIVTPICVYALMTALGFDGDFRGIATITFGTPTAAAIGMMCMDKERYLHIGPPAVAFMSILSVVILPLMLVFLA